MAPPAIDVAPDFNILAQITVATSEQPVESEVNMGALLHLRARHDAT